MSHSGGYRKAIRERLRDYGLIHKVLSENHKLCELQELIYINWLAMFKSNEMKTKTLKTLFYRDPNDTEATVFDRIIPWHALLPIEKRNYSKLVNWVSYHENMYK